MNERREDLVDAQGTGHHRLQLRLRMPLQLQRTSHPRKCEGGWTWHVERGASTASSVDGLNFSVYANWPGAIHEGNGEALILVDERADERQRAAIATLVGGTVGGPWGTLAWTWPTIRGPLAVRYDIE